MRTHRPSTTAMMVALWRALADDGYTSVRGFSDPLASDMLTGGFRYAHELLRQRLEHAPAAQRERICARYDPIPIRVAVIDAELLDALYAGCKQVVILGAGFDTRAYRLDALAGLSVFELDHPATQRAKQTRVNALAPKAKLIWTPIDFERDSLVQRLAAARHDAREPTAWIWEGVVMYLDDAAVSSTLAAIHARSAPGSKLILHYHEPSAGRMRRTARNAVLTWLGEPQIGVRSRVAMQQLVTQARFAIDADLGIAEQARKVGARAPDNDLARVSRILVAHPLSA